MAGHLTEVERLTLDYMAIGLTDREIAVVTGYTVSGVKSQVCRVLDKLEAVNRSHAVYIGFRRCLLSRTRRITVPAAAARREPRQRSAAELDAVAR